MHIDSKENPPKGVSTSSPSSAEPLPQEQVYPSWVTFVRNLFLTCIEYFGLLLCYIAMVLAAALSRYSVVSFIYLTMVFVCWIAHYLSGNPHIIKRLWLSYVICSGIILVVKYIYQFEPVSTYLTTTYALNYCILMYKLKDIDLIYVRHSARRFRFSCCRGWGSI